MACSSKPGVAMVLNYLNEHHGGRITQTDWHAIRMLTESEQGKPLSRKQSSWKDVNAVGAQMLATAGDTDNVEFLNALTKERNTDGTLRALDYLNRHGVLETLARVRKPVSQPKINSYAVSLTIPDEKGNVREYNYNVGTDESLVELLNSAGPTASARVWNEGESKEVDSVELARLRRETELRVRDENSVIPETTIYGVGIEASLPDGRTQRWNGSVSSVKQLRELIDGSTNVTKVSVTEERIGYTLAEPQKRQTQNVELSDDEIAILLNPNADEVA